MTARRRRPPGEGSVFEYQTRAGVIRFGIKFDAPSADGQRRQVMRRRDGNGQPWLTREAAADALREARVQVRRGDWIEPSKQPVAAYLATWLDGLRLAPGTMTGYRGNVRNHVVPYIGALPLASLTSARLTALYRELEESGRRDHKGERTGKPLSARTVRGVATMLGRRARRRAQRRGSAADPQPGREGQAAHSQGSGREGPGDAPVDRRAAPRLPGLVGRPQPGARAPGTCSPALACAAVSCSRSAGVTST